MRSVVRSLTAVGALLLLLPSPGAGEALPLPPALEPAVRFWERIYTEVDTRGGLIHDSVDLSVVYEHVRFSEGMSRRSREHEVEREKRRIRDVLRRLAQGRRSGLSAEEAEVLAAWPAGVSDETLRRAARNVRFQLGQADRFRAGWVRSGAWIDHIRETLRRHGVPPELAALPHVESSFTPDAYSRVGAAGLWQFTRSTGRLFMRIDSVVDERLDPFTATDAAARLLVKNYELTGAWPLAITAYNHGAAGMQRAVRQLGTRDIAEIVRRYRGRTFGFASRNFYTSFLAAVAVERRADTLFAGLQQHAPVAYTLIEMPHYYRATSLSAALGVDTATLRRHNGALRPSVWQGQKYVPRGYSLRVPAAALEAPPELLLARVPEGERLAAQHRDRFHKVRRGETISTIARRYGISQSDLVAANHLRSRHRIRAGQVLTLPGVEPPVDVARQPVPEDGSYTVRRGDTLSIIARRFGISESELVRRNGLRSRHRIYVGQRLSLSGEAPATGGPVQVASTEPVTVATAVASPEIDERVAGPAPEPEVEEILAEQEPQPEPEMFVERDLEVAESELAEAEVAEAEVAEVEIAEVEIAEVEITEVEIAEVEIAEAELAASETAAAEPETASVPGPTVQPAREPAATALADRPPAAPPDLSDYSVHDGRVTVQAAETLGHYAEWLEVRASDLRAKNGMRYGQPLVIGRRIHLDFRRVTPEEFERRRLEYHRTLQDEFFSAFEVTGTASHVLRRGESVWYLAERKYRIPLWLLRQYNPDLDFGSLPAGTAMTVPLVEERSDAG